MHRTTWTVIAALTGLVGCTPERHPGDTAPDSASATDVVSAGSEGADDVDRGRGQRGQRG